MAATYIDNADQGADFMVTPCPLCHISLDNYQKKSVKQAKASFNVPVMHLSQMVGLALGIGPDKLGLSRHIVTTAKALSKWTQR